MRGETSLVGTITKEDVRTPASRAALIEPSDPFRLSSRRLLLSPPVLYRDDAVDDGGGGGGGGDWADAARGLLNCCDID